jgi:hypothetical protein
VNDGQLIDNVPAPGCPFAKYTVPCTVVVLTACAIAVAASTVATAYIAIPRIIRNHSSFMRFIPIASLFSLHIAKFFSPGPTAADRSAPASHPITN